MSEPDWSSSDQRPQAPATTASSTTPPRSTASVRSHSSSPSRPTEASDGPSEQTPLLSRQQDGVQEDAHQPNSRPTSSAASLLRAFQGKSKNPPRWPSILALLMLCLVVLLIIVLGFLAPAVVQEYAMQAAVFEPTGLSIQAFTAHGVRARVQGQFTMDASRVKKKPVRDLGRFGTWIARQVETGHSSVHVSLPEYGNVLLGTADVPNVLVDIRNGHTTAVDFLSDLQPGDIDGIRRIAKDWLDGRLGQLRILGSANVPLKSGLFSFGTQKLSQSFTFAPHDIPTLPDYKVHHLNFHEIETPDFQDAIQTNVSLSIRNPYPVDFTIPPLGFGVLVGNCYPADPLIQLADATTAPLHIAPEKTINVDVSAFVRHLPHSFTKPCPDRRESPMDLLLSSYIHGNTTTVYVRGSDSPSLNTPRWMTDLMSDITVPVPVPGHTFGHLIRNFTLARVHFGLPDPFADPGTPEAQPHISAGIKATIVLPKEMNFDVNVSQISADADVLYHGSKMGFLDLSKWQPANSTRLDTAKDEAPMLAVESLIEDAPLTITDEDVFTDVIQEMMFGGKQVILTIKANVNVKLETVLGPLTVRKIPASGSVPVKPINRGGMGQFAPKIGNLQILDTGKNSLTLEALVNFTNPTPYSAYIPYADIHILSNGSLLGHATAKSLSIGPGANVNLPITAIWDPLSLGGKAAHAVGVELLSQYISGYNTTITIRAHNGTIPSQPALGRALESLPIEMPTPSLGGPPRDGDGGGDCDNDGNCNRRPHFIEDATMHLFTSTATFTLLSPLKTSTLYVTYLNATAFYHDDEVGHIDYDLPFAIPPGTTTSPRLPVDWNLGSVGYDAVRGALGGTLKLSARAVVGIRLGKWEERIWYQGGGIGAKIRL